MSMELCLCVRDEVVVCAISFGLWHMSHFILAWLMGCSNWSKISVKHRFGSVYSPCQTDPIGSVCGAQIKQRMLKEKVK